jgi:hypothetical protein
MKLPEEINLNVRFKNPIEFDSALTSLINIIKQATQDATPTPKISLRNKTRYVPIEIKKLISEKRRRKAPGIEEVTPIMLKETSRKFLLMLTYIFNAILKQKYWPSKLKTAEIIMIPKPGKNPNNVSSYRPISLLPIISKLLEKLLLKRIRSHPNTEEWIASHQFGFRENHFTVQQIHRITHKIHQALENKEYCTSVFLDVRLAFDKIWYPGLLYKIKKYLPITYFHILKSYINSREFRTRISDSISNNSAIKSGVPQGSVLGPPLYLFYTAGLPVNANTTMGTFADDTVILSVNIGPAISTFTLQNHLNQIQESTNIWKRKVNEAKSTQVNFSLRREKCPAIFLNNVQIPPSPSKKYLGIYLENHLTWNEHLRKKR